MQEEYQMSYFQYFLKHSTSIFQAVKTTPSILTKQIFSKSINENIRSSNQRINTELNNSGQMSPFAPKNYHSKNAPEKKVQQEATHQENTINERGGPFNFTPQ